MSIVITMVVKISHSRKHRTPTQFQSVYAFQQPVINSTQNMNLQCENYISAFVNALQIDFKFLVVYKIVTFSIQNIEYIFLDNKLLHYLVNCQKMTNVFRIK